MPTPTAPTTPAAPTTPTHVPEPPDGPSRGPGSPRRAGRLLAGGLAAAVVATVGVTVQDVRTSDAAAQATAQHVAATELVGDLTAARLAFDDHARAAEHAATRLLRHQAAVIAGGSRDGDLVASQLETLRAEADALATLADAALPERPRAVAVADADPLLARLDAAADQAASLAERLHDAADTVEAFDATTRELWAAAASYAEAASLPSSEDPEQVAAAWRDELDLLATYRDDLDAVDADATTPALTPIADAQHAFIDELEAVAERAVELLEGGELDAYSDLRDERLAGGDLLGTADALADAREDVTAGLLAGPLEDVRGRALGLRMELGDLREVTSQLVAS